MKRFVLVGLLFCSVTLHADVVPLTRNYAGMVDSFFRRGGTIYSLSDTTTNGEADAYDTTYPYTGGAFINHPTNIMSPDAIQMAVAFNYASGKPECWGSCYVEGTIEVEETFQFPLGMPLELQIDYASVDISSSMDFLSQGVVLMDHNYNTLWDADYSTNGNIEKHSVQITAGTMYFFILWQDFGTPTTPIIANSTRLAAVALDFSVIPEPTTLLLLGMGGLLIRKR